MDLVGDFHQISPTCLKPHQDNLYVPIWTLRPYKLHHINYVNSSSTSITRRRRTLSRSIITQCALEAQVHCVRGDLKRSALRFALTEPLPNARSPWPCRRCPSARLEPASAVPFETLDLLAPVGQLLLFESKKLFSLSFHSLIPTLALTSRCYRPKYWLKCVFNALPEI